MADEGLAGGDATEAFWREYAEATGVTGAYETVAFGDSPEMATELPELVLVGTERATAGLARDVEGPDAEAAPVEGGHVVLVDGARRPRAVRRTTQLVRCRFDEVDEDFARDEGEGERTLAWWRQGHRAYFGRPATREGWTFAGGDESVVLERFAVVWTPEHADGR